MGWIAGRVYRQKITIQEGNVFADHTDFPVAIKITGSNEVFTKAQSDGYDILFAADDEVPLSYERVRWDPGSQILVVYVKTDLSSSESTEFYMYYGNGGNTITTDGQDAEGVWASHYKGVYHFEEASGQLQDSTSNARNSTTANTIKYRYGGLHSYSCYFDGSGDYFIIPTGLEITGNSARTVTAYFYPEWAYNQMGSWSALIRLGGDSGTRTAWIMSLDNAGECSPSESIGLHYWGTNTCTGERVVTSGDEILTSTWHQYAGTHNGGTTQRVFLNGTQRGTSGYTLITLAGTTYIGGRGNGNYRGRLSEIRVSNTDLGSNWIRTEYENMINNDTFFTLGAEEDTPYLIEDIPTAVTIYDDANSIYGTRNYLTEFTLQVASTTYYDMPVDVSLADIVQTTSGTDDVDVELGLSASGILTDAEFDTDVDFYVSSSGIFNTDVRNTVLDFTVGREPVPVTDPYGGIDVRDELGIGHIVTPSGYGEDVDVELGIGNIFDAETDLDVDFSIATSAIFNYAADVYGATISGTWITGQGAGTWADTDYGYRQEITIDSSLLSNSVTDFPLAIKVGSGNDLFVQARADGYDIFFTEDDGLTVLDYERTIYDAGDEDFQAFVQTDLSSTTDTIIYMYYGYASATDQATGSAAWDANFDAVWHFEDGTYTGAANEVQDSSGNGNHGRRGSGDFQGFDSTWGQALNITDSNDWMRFESNLNINAEYTISCLFWVPLSNSTSWHTLTRGSSYHQIILRNDHVLGNYQSGFHSSGFDMDTLSNGLHHVAVVRLPGGTGDFYVDGAFVGNAALQPQDDIYAVGNYQGNGQHWGQIDEFRVSASTGRTASWIKAEYESLVNYATFVTFGDPEEPGGYWELANYFETDVTVSGGLSYPINTDVYASVSGIQYNYLVDCYATLANTTPSGLPLDPLISGSFFSTDVTTSGGLSYPLETDLYVSLVNVVDTVTVDGPITAGSYFSADMRLHALQIDNFFLDVDEYVTSTATMYVDITDKRRIPIDTANCYFIIDGVPVTSGIWFTPVDRPTASGYRMYYDPPGDFTADDSIEVIVHAENVINDMLEQTYYLLWGYNLIVNATELHSWGWDKEVIVWSTATNLARCPAESADAWHIRTAPKPSKDLAASIVPQVKHKDLSAVIYPISTAIFYDGTYKITVNLKDSAGNEMPPVILELWLL
jgi:hypothetical protein